nr:MAG TPA: hypothetical protein [Caudoviricetes sp.]
MAWLFRSSPLRIYEGRVAQSISRTNRAETAPYCMNAVAVMLFPTHA